MLLPTSRSSSPNGLSATSPENPQPPQDGQDVTLGNGRRVSVSSAPPHSPDPFDDVGEFWMMVEQSGGSNGMNPQEVLQGAIGGPPPEQNETQWGIRPHSDDRHRHHHSRHSCGHQRSHHHHHNPRPDPQEPIIVERKNGVITQMTAEQFERRYNPDGRGRSYIRFVYRKDRNGVLHAVEQRGFDRANKNITETG